MARTAEGGGGGRDLSVDNPGALQRPFFFSVTHPSVVSLPLFRGRG